MEIWKPINLSPYNKIYECSSLGRIKSTDRRIRVKTNNQYSSFSKIVHRKSHILHFHTSHSGYYLVGLNFRNKRKTFSVHRLIALTFLPNPHHYRDVNHKDENKLNNKISNLEWCTPKYNTNYGTGKMRSVEKRMHPVILVDKNKRKTFPSFKSAGKFLQEKFNYKKTSQYFETRIATIKSNPTRHSVYGYYCIFP